MSKTIIITGASSGFGRETAKLFQQQGWNVVATMRSPENEQELSNLENVLVTRLDVQDSESIQNTVNEVLQRFGSIDVLLNNAGYGLMGVFESAAPDQIQKQFAVNVFGLMDVTRAVLPQMRKQSSGTIINLSSFGGQVGLPFGSLYNSSKFAVEGFSESLSHEVSALGISVKIIEPGGVNTNFRNGLEMIKNEIAEYNPLMGNFFGRYASTTAHLPKATPEDVAQTIYNAATDGKAQLRYVIGEDAQFYIDTKYQNGDPDFIKIMRDRFVN
jgi:NAD(P)-dependent dehydrogenase (short-subunit alcohol dehydrogenase family)